jgi:hypothetical protein
MRGRYRCDVGALVANTVEQPMAGAIQLALLAARTARGPHLQLLQSTTVGTSTLLYQYLSIQHCPSVR